MRESAFKGCGSQDQQSIEGEDHVSIVKPRSESSDIHQWLKRILAKNEKQEMPWKLRRWIGREEQLKGIKREQVCTIVVAGKKFHDCLLDTELIGWYPGACKYNRRLHGYSNSCQFIADILFSMARIQRDLAHD